MNQELWNKILAFDFDNPHDEYGFSIRLANENYWTKSFTEQSILEYKKFMYLAATSDFMVSPSEIIDAVWHQHLIFTQSYHNFCNILGKTIQHVPSTHNKEDFEKFKQAKSKTNIAYENIFGEQPKNIWVYKDIFDSLNLEKAQLKIRTFIIIGIITFIVLAIPAYFLLKPIYIEIDNPDFMIGYCFLTIITLFTLELYNRAKLNNIISLFDKTSFVYFLQPFELVYLKTQKLSYVINGAVNELIANGILKINSNNTIECVNDDSELNNEQLQIVATLNNSESKFYPILLKKLAPKPIFTNYTNCIDAFIKYFNKSKKFGRLFYLNFIVLSILLILIFTRVVTGILRDKPVTQVVILTIILSIIIVVYLQRLTSLVSTLTIPNIYKERIVKTKQIDYNWRWSYFLHGTAVLATAFVPIVNYIDRNNSGGNSCGNSCGSSCGGGGCGGCGGGGD